MVALNSCHTVSAGIFQEFKGFFVFFLLTLGFPSLGMFVFWGQRETGNRCFPKHHWLFMSLRCTCCRNRSVTPFLCFVEQMFCCQLEELIHWLYTVVDVTSSWVPPSPDAESVLASLHRYLVGVTLALLPPLSCAAGSKQWEARHHWNGPGCTAFAKPNLGAPGTCSVETAPWATCHRCVFQKPF